MQVTEIKKKSFLSGLTGQIIIAMVLGAILGIIIHNSISQEAAESFSAKIKMLATVFIRLVQMIISPLVFTTLVVGIAKLGDIKTVGRVGGKALGWFFTASFISLLIGLFYVNILEPGKGIKLGNVNMAAASEVTGKTKILSFENFVEHIVPKSIFEAMATNEILQIVIFSIFFGLAAASLGSTVKPVINALDKTSHIVLKMVNYVMKFAPIGVFGAIAGVFAIRDAEELRPRIEDFKKLLSDVITEKDVFVLAYNPFDQTINVYKNEVLKGKVPGFDFKKALFGIWLSDKPVDETLKKNLLGI